MKVLTAMSGGVDSSVAALLLKQQGYECAGCTLRLWAGDPDEYVTDSKSCCKTEDIAAAEAVARRLEMPFYVLNYTDRFRESVIRDFTDNYVAGRTPNPCIVCNKTMKFGALAEQAKLMGYDFIATGHYARICRENGRFVLKKALNPQKDQSYVLYFLTQDQLAHTLFPLGELEKTRVREIAAENGFENAKKSDSQDICFVPDGDYAGFIRTFSGKDFPEGDVIDTSGRVLGRHRGIINYTIGQRKGLGISAETPLYVKKIDSASNTVVLAKNEEMFSDSCRAVNFNWISGTVPDGPVRCKVRVRYHHKEQGASVIPLSEKEVEIYFDVPVRAVTPGQAAVLYDGDTVLGGGTIL